MKKYTIKTEHVLHWLYNTGADQDQITMRTELGDSIIEQLINEGKVTITPKELFDGCEQSCIQLRFIEG